MEELEGGRENMNLGKRVSDFTVVVRRPGEQESRDSKSIVGPANQVITASGQRQASQGKDNLPLSRQR